MISTVAFGTPVRNFLKFGARGMGDGGLSAVLGNEAIRMGCRFANSCEFGVAASMQGLRVSGWKGCELAAISQLPRG